MVLTIFFLGKALYDDRVGLLAAFLLCIDPVHWVCSERIWMETTMSFFMLLAVLFFVLGERQKYYLPLSGLSIGLAMLTKYPGILPLFIIISFVVLMDRSMLRQKYFWVLCCLSLFVLSPWIIWNWKVHGGFNEAFIAAHNLGKHWENAAGALSGHKETLLVLLVLAGLGFIVRRKISLFFGMDSTSPITLKQKRIMTGACFLATVLILTMIPFLRGMIKEAFIWKDAILTGWSNPFKGEPWYFYLTRLAELSPLYLFSFLSVFLFLGRDKSDQLLIWSSLWILGAFILWGNYQSRYILPAVPFLIILSARCQVWVYDKLSSSPAIGGEASNSRSYRALLRILFVGMVFYFILKTLRTDWLIAIGPDFGYF